MVLLLLLLLLLKAIEHCKKREEEKRPIWHQSVRSLLDDLSTLSMLEEEEQHIPKTRQDKKPPTH